MIKKFRKKPVVIEAVQWDGNNFDEVSNFTKNFHGHKKAYEDAEEGSIKLGKYYIVTLEGVMTADKMDWIIKGVNGEFYPCKPDIFEKTYEDATLPSAVTGGMKWVKAVKEFHVAMDVNYHEEPIAGLSIERHRLRCDILEEEVKELRLASINNNIIEVADGICDCIYILIGTAWEFGLANKLDAMFMEVHRSNMSKMHNGKAVKREDGKVIKSPNYSKPDLNSILGQPEQGGKPFMEGKDETNKGATSAPDNES